MRTNGVLMPVFSLPSRYGIGDMGKEAYRFVDFLAKAGQSFWQILPLNPTNYGDSPYQSFSTFAGNPYFISPEKLIEDGLLTWQEADSFDFGQDPLSVDYGKMFENRPRMLRIAYDRFKQQADHDAYRAFVDSNSQWLDEYALFMALKDQNGQRSWITWDKPYKFRDPQALEQAAKDYADDMDFYRFCQYEFFTQWNALKSYANEKGIRIIGDLPIYVAMDSADVWSNTKQFQLDQDLNPVKVSGCPPDAFSADGQLWGNPLYRWEDMANEKPSYQWWKKRSRMALSIYDVVRIDHFRGFESYYTIPFGDKTAANGKWVKGPGLPFFTEIEKELGTDLPIIAEDLGYLTKEVRDMLKGSGFPGMKVLQFAFDSREASDYLPHNYEHNCVVYTGTHDNDTIMGWTKTAPADDVAFARKYMHADDSEGFNWTMMRIAQMSVADTCILMMNDFVGLGSEARINTPSTLGKNWKWRIDGSCINDWLAGIIYENTKMYGRLPKQKPAQDPDYGIKD